MNLLFRPVDDLTKVILEKWKEQSSFQELFELKEMAVHPSLFPFVIFYEERAIGVIQIYSATDANRGHWHTNQLGNFGLDLFVGEEKFQTPIMLKTILDFFLKKLFRPHELNEVLSNPQGDSLDHVSLFFGADFKIEETMMMKDGCSILLDVFWI